MSKDTKPEKPQIPTSSITPPVGGTIQNSDWSVANNTTTKTDVLNTIKGIIKSK